MGILPRRGCDSIQKRMRLVSQGTQVVATSFIGATRCNCRLTTRALGPRIELAGRRLYNLISHDAKTPSSEGLGTRLKGRATSIRDSQQAEQPTPVAPAYPEPSSLWPLRSF